MKTISVEPAAITPDTPSVTDEERLISAVAIASALNIEPPIVEEFRA